MAGEDQWRRFERSASRRAGGTKFWAIRVEGTRCLVRHGFVGEADEHEDKALEFGDGSEARAQHKKRIRTKLRAGWVEVEPEGAGAVELDGAALEDQLRAAIVAGPGDLDAWLVYADFLAQRAPVLGERLALGLALARTSDRRARRRIEGRIQQLEASEARALLGPTLAGLLGDRRFEHAIVLDRRFGMIVGAEVHDRASFDWRFEATISSLLELDAASVLLALGIYGGHRSGPFVAGLDRLLSAPRKTLQVLRLDFAQVENSAEWRRGRFRRQLALPSLAELSAGMPALERLTLVGPFGLGPCRHPKLRALALRRVGVVRGLELGGCELPALERLELAGPYGASGWRELELPRLRELVVNVPGKCEAVIRALLDAALLDQLEVLALGAHGLGAGTVSLLVEHAPRFAGLDRLVLVDPPARLELGELQRQLPVCEVHRTGQVPRSRSARILVEYDGLGPLGAVRAGS